VLFEVVEHGLSPVYDFSRQTINRSRKAGDRTMPDTIIQVNQAMFETQLDRMVTQKVTEILNRMLDASGRREHRCRTLRALRFQEGVSCRSLRA
jgi:hypothetical protein